MSLRACQSELASQNQSVRTRKKKEKVCQNQSVGTTQSEIISPKHLHPVRAREKYVYRGERVGDGGWRQRAMFHLLWNV